MANYNEITISLAAAQLAQAQDIAVMAAPYGIYVEDYTDLEQIVRDITHSDLIDEALLEKDRSRALIHVYLAPQDHLKEAAAWLSERLAAEGIAHEIGTQACRSEDWENNWKAYFRPMPVGERLLIQPAWETPAALESGENEMQGRKALLIEPGLAFGSGSHATTRLCMEALERKIKPGCDVLDIGCGSGILAVAAMLLGAGSALGVDIDPMAVKNARENAARNGLSCQFAQGDLAGRITGRFDVIVSNIVADAIVSLAGQVEKHLNPGGVWISSGIIDTREDDVLAAFAANGFRVLDRHEEGGWLCFAAGR